MEETQAFHLFLELSTLIPFPFPCLSFSVPFTLFPFPSFPSLFLFSPVLPSFPTWFPSLQLDIFPPEQRGAIAWSFPPPSRARNFVTNLYDPWWKFVNSPFKAQLESIKAWLRRRPEGWVNLKHLTATQQVLCTCTSAYVLIPPLRECWFLRYKENKLHQ